MTFLRSSVVYPCKYLNAFRFVVQKFFEDDLGYLFGNETMSFPIPGVFVRY